MSRFFFADGSIEDHPTPPDCNAWNLHRSHDLPASWDAIPINPNGAFMRDVFTFHLQPCGAWWEYSPNKFDPGAALCRLVDALAAQKELVLKTARALRSSVYAEGDPCDGHLVLRDLDRQGVAWWKDE